MQTLHVGVPDAIVQRVADRALSLLQPFNASEIVSFD